MEFRQRPRIESDDGEPMLGPPPINMEWFRRQTDELVRRMIEPFNNPETGVPEQEVPADTSDRTYAIGVTRADGSHLALYHHADGNAPHVVDIQLPDHQE